MISELHQLSEKVTQLAELARSLRQENAELRRTVAALSGENEALSSRINEAYTRVSALLDSIPGLETQDKEAA